MGAIMCIGVSVSNSVMLVTFANRNWQRGLQSLDAAKTAAKERLRPIMMTACAMIVGMVPMSLALESGSQMEAPLGRAVIGGLLVSTFATLLMLPPIFSLVIGEQSQFRHRLTQTTRRARTTIRKALKRPEKPAWSRVFSVRRLKTSNQVRLGKNILLQETNRMSALVGTDKLSRIFDRMLRACLVLVFGALIACGAKEQSAPAAHVDPAVQSVKPQRRTITRHVGQPAFIDAFERTSMYPRISGYIRKWNVDIGDVIKKDQVLAELFVPDLEAEYQQKQAEVVQEKAMIDVAEQSVGVAESKLESSRADLEKAQADIGAFQAAVDRWQSEVKRLTKMADDRVIDRQVLDESQKQLKSNISARAAAEAGVKAAEANIVSRQAEVSKARADVEAARATAKVGEANEQRYAALYSYTKLTAPYDGIVVVRNANTGDFVQPAGGDRSVSPTSSGGGEVRGDAIYVVARTDLVRVFVDVPEMDANHVSRGTEAHVRVQSLDDADFAGVVTRSSWALNTQTRTLRAEIDLPNPQAQLLPGMYAYAEVIVKRSDVLAVPLAAIAAEGNQNICYLLQNDKAIKTPVQTGGNDGQWIEVIKKQVAGKWVPLMATRKWLSANYQGSAGAKRFA